MIVPNNHKLEHTPKPKKLLRIVYKFILISLAVHIVGLFIFGGIIIFQRMQAQPVTFKEPVNLVKVEPKKREYKMRIKEQQARASRPKLQPRLQSTSVAPMALPVVDTKISPVKSQLADIPGLADGIGSGLGFGGELGNFTSFGYTLASAGALEGQLFDLKRDKQGNELRSMGGDIKNRIREFVSGSWRMSDLSKKYPSATKKLYASYWIIPNIRAEEAPESFGAAGEIESKGIVAVYEGSFIPKESKEIRFCGVADDALLVRLESRIVLDGSVEDGYCDEFEYNKNGEGPVIAEFTRPVRYGDWVNLQSGRIYDLKILIAENPGYWFGCFLFYQEKGSEDFKVFTTRPFTPRDKRHLRNVHPDIARAIK